MRRKTTFLLSLLLTIALGVSAQTSEPRHEILLETDSGNVRIALYNETPQHRDNILRLVEAHAYDGVLFHRVISNFMVQTGDLGSIGAPQGKLLGDTPEKYSVPAEFDSRNCFISAGPWQQPARATMSIRSAALRPHSFILSGDASGTMRRSTNCSSA